MPELKHTAAPSTRSDSRANSRAESAGQGRPDSAESAPAQEANPAPAQQTDQQTDQRWGLFLGLRRNAWVEILAFLLLMEVIDLLWFDGSRFVDVHPHPFWIIVLLASVQYGSGAGMIATGLSSLLLLAGNLPEMGLDEDLHGWMLDLSSRPLMWLGASVIIGELSARNIRERRTMAMELARARKDEKTITASFEELQSLRERLEVRVAGQLRTVSKTWQAARAIQQLDPAQVLMGVTEMVSTLLEPKKFSVFTFTDNRLQAAIQKGWRRKDHFERYFTEQSALFQAVVGDHAVLSIHHPEDEVKLQGQGVLAGPLINPDTGEMIGMLKIEDLGFSQMSVSSLENFRFICEWIGSVYGNAVKHEQSRARQFFNSEDNLYSEAFFNRHKLFLMDLAHRVGFELSMVTIRLNNFQHLPVQARNQFAVFLGQTVQEVLRDTDLAFNQQSDQWEFAIILPGTPLENARIVQDKLESTLDRKVGLLGRDLEYSFVLEDLNPKADRLEAPAAAPLAAPFAASGGQASIAGGKPMLGDPFAESGAFFLTQKGFLTDLSRRLNFDLTRLRVRCAQFPELPTEIREAFGRRLGDMLARELRNTDMPLNFQVSTGEFMLLLPQTTVEQVKHLEPRLHAAILDSIGEANAERFRTCFNFDVTALNVQEDRP